MRFRDVLVCSLLTIVLSARSAHAFSIPHPTETESASYKLYYAGIAIGKLSLSWEADAGYYRLSFTMKTTGMMRLLKTQRRTAEITGKRQDGGFIPIHYHASVIYPHKQKSSDMSYEHGSLRDVVNEPAEEVSLSDVQKESAVDPITGLFQLFSYMGNADPQTSPFATVYFDGKRLARGYALPAAEPVLHCDGTCRAYRLNRLPLAGFDARELSAYGTGEPPLFVLFQPGSRFPVSAYIHATLGTVTMIKEKD